MQLRNGKKTALVDEKKPTKPKEETKRLKPAKTRKEEKTLTNKQIMYLGDLMGLGAPNSKKMRQSLYDEGYLHRKGETPKDEYSLLESDWAQLNDEQMRVQAQDIGAEILNPGDEPYIPLFKRLTGEGIDWQKMTMKELADYWRRRLASSRRSSRKWTPVPVEHKSNDAMGALNYLLKIVKGAPRSVACMGHSNLLIPTLRTQGMSAERLCFVSERLVLSRDKSDQVHVGEIITAERHEYYHHKVVGRYISRKTKHPYPYNPAEIIEYCKPTQNIALSLSLYTWNQSAGHENMLFINREQKRIEHFEPHGDNAFWRKYLEENITKLLKLPDYHYYSAYTKCPRILGPQRRQDAKHLWYCSFDDSGYCVAYAQIYANLRVLSPDAEPEETVAALDTLDKDSDQLLDFVTRYLGWQETYVGYVDD